MKDMHPAMEWAVENRFNSMEVDCTTAVALKILDGKCKMLPGEMAAVLAIYDVVRALPGKLFGADDHQTIRQAREELSEQVKQEIHRLRLYAEASIPKPTMKAYKARLREGLFG